MPSARLAMPHVDTRKARKAKRTAIRAWRTVRRVALRLPDEYEAFVALLDADPELMADRASNDKADEPFYAGIVAMFDGGYRLKHDRALSPATREALEALVRASRDDEGFQDYGMNYGMLLPAVPRSATLRAVHMEDRAPGVARKLRSVARLLWWSGEREAAERVLGMDAAKG